MKKTLLLLALTSLFGCGDGNVNETHSGALEASDPTRPEDGSYYDEYTFSTKSGAAVEITMTSTALDPYLLVVGPGVDEQNDDMVPGSNLNAQVRFTAPQNGTFTVHANSAGAGETGAYTLTIRATMPQ